MSESIGEQIINEIIKQGMIRAEACGDNMIYIWNGNAAEQLEALVLNFIESR